MRTNGQTVDGAYVLLPERSSYAKVKASPKGYFEFRDVPEGVTQIEVQWGEFDHIVGRSSTGRYPILPASAPVSREEWAKTVVNWTPLDSRRIKPDHRFATAGLGALNAFRGIIELPVAARFSPLRVRFSVRPSGIESSRICGLTSDQDGLTLKLDPDGDRVAEYGSEKLTEPVRRWIEKKEKDAEWKATLHPEVREEAFIDDPFYLCRTFDLRTPEAVRAAGASITFTVYIASVSPLRSTPPIDSEIGTYHNEKVPN